MNMWSIHDNMFQQKATCLCFPPSKLDVPSIRTYSSEMMYETYGAEKPLKARVYEPRFTTDAEEVKSLNRVSVIKRSISDSIDKSFSTNHNIFRNIDIDDLVIRQQLHCSRTEHDDRPSISPSYKKQSTYQCQNRKSMSPIYKRQLPYEQDDGRSTCYKSQSYLDDRRSISFHKRTAFVPDSKFLENIRNGYKREKLKLVFNDHDDKDDDRTFFDNQISWKNVSSSPYLISPHSPLNIQRHFSYPTSPYDDENRYHSVDRGNMHHLPIIRKRIRTVFTPNQLQQLEGKFQESSFIVGEDRLMLANKLKLGEQQVKIWFQNRRTSEKNKSIKVGKSKF